ncbi:primase-helicase zinc-binding domain-containing protein [Pectobacterium versatile]|uniref:primase-helicase zinc-binding domain-containing protein n=1 Tax=Pectobacterium versatile TaxID=2488639 RepID=UPI001CCF5B78|nr:primase-helicase zinc-binding domain-containing protein [Pectobacterium versatile]
MAHLTVTQAVKRASGHWPQLLPAVGIRIDATGQHTACPMCEGKDRFRFDNKEGRGTWFCNQCGAGDGLNLVEKALKLTPTEAALKVGAWLGDQPDSPAAPTSDDADSEAARQRAAVQAQAKLKEAVIQSGNTYLSAKGWPDMAVPTLQGKPLRVGGVAYQPGDVLVPLTTPEGEVVNLQLINAQGDKRTLKGGQVKGTFHAFSGKQTSVIWLAEGYATGLTLHQLTGDMVYVALSANNLPSLARELKTRHPAVTLLIAADRDENGTGQTKAEQAAVAVNGRVALPPVFGDWNDVYRGEGADATRQHLNAFTQPEKVSPFESLGEAEFKAMSASEKAEKIRDHYRDTLAIDAFGETFFQYQNGAWKVLPYRLLSRDIAALFQKIQAPFTASGIGSVLDTLKLIIPMQEKPQRRLIGFRNGVFDTVSGEFKPHRREHWLNTVNDVDCTPFKAGENLADNAPHFWRWLTRAAGNHPDKQERILAALFMVLANCYDWQLFLEVTGPGGSGKSILAEIATMLAGEDNTTAATINTIESSRERSSIIGFSLIVLPDQEKWSGDGAGIKAITGGDAVMVDPKYRDAYSTRIPAVILAVNNSPMRFSDRSGGVSRRRVIIHFGETIPASERDPKLKEKIRTELAVIVRHLMKRFEEPNDARTLLQAQQHSAEALEIKRQADPLVDFCGYLLAHGDTTGLYMGNANITPRNPRKYLYHAYLSFMESHGHQKPISLTAFGKVLPNMMSEYGQSYLKGRTKQGIQTNLELKDESDADWLPKCESAR